MQISQFAPFWVAIAFTAALSPQLCAQTGSTTPPPPITKTTTMNLHASGTFDVKMQPIAPTPEDQDDGLALTRMSIDKQFQGDLVATSKGQMLTTGISTEKSGAYVAIERVTGTLAGRKGTFALHHTGIMTRGNGDLTINVVPDSGTGELEGIAGKCTIRIEAGKHFYTFDYALPEK